MGSSEAVDTIRVLARSQDHIPTTIAHRYGGPPEGAELMLSLDLFEVDGSREWDIPHIWPLLTIVIDMNARNPIWESFIRRLLRWGVDLHAPEHCPVHRIASQDYPSDWPLGMPFLGTPLDQLLGLTKTPFDGHVEAQRWLRLLDSEDYDVRAYLEKEEALHASHCFVVLPSFATYRGPPRQIRFELEKEPPELHWDWWTNPCSPAFLVLEEFKWMNGVNEDYNCRDFSWLTFWPFDVLNDWDEERHDDNERSAAVQRKRLCAARWKRKQRKKEAKANGYRDIYRMPGSWPG